MLKPFRTLLLLIVASVSLVAVAKPTKPNIIFILSDDLAMGDVGVYGQKLIKTPRLDQMAAEGTRFTQTYCGTSVCAPSRTSLMTGLHMGHSPVRANREIAAGEGQFPLPAQTVTVASILKSAGYATACTGKWGMGMFNTTGSPLKKGFDHFFGYNCQRHAHDYFPTYLYNDDQRFDLPGNTGKGVGKTYAQNLIQKDALKWVREKANQPFFLFYAVTLPHGKQEIDDVGEYAAHKDWSEQERVYAAQVTRLDRDVGQLLDLLKELKIDENTIVFFAGDNGSQFAPDSPIGKRFDQSMGGQLRGCKRSMYEGGLRQAGLVRWPGTVPAKRVSDEPWAFWDFLPTALELSGASVPKSLQPDGFSLVSFLKGGPAPKREYFYWELHESPSNQAIRFGDWKAVKNAPGAAVELYDLKSDAAEQKDVAAAHPDLVEKAVRLMKQARVDDPNWPMFAGKKKAAKK
ncbi:MAG: N-acetylgalactosamine-6-sulfatase [Verrucomicrobiales bacterium]|nr:N-acetylgalactosamine-6-sulfatase [Verrucomicrobiales bacterium]